MKNLEHSYYHTTAKGFAKARDAATNMDATDRERTAKLLDLAQQTATADQQLEEIDLELCSDGME